jgi:threonine synthase
MIRYLCPACGSRFEVTPDRFRCDCSAPLDLDFSAAKIDVDALGRRPTNLWRWHEALPLLGPLPTASLGEGICPVVEDRIGDTPVHLVLDFVSPTGSYKDRGASLLTAVAAALGVDEVFDDSSGNAAIALAAHAARSGLRARVLVPADAPLSKPSLARRLGAEVVRVEGGRAAASAAALREAETGSFYASHAWSPFFLHGTKTLAYVLAESLRWTVPDAVLAPCGNGGLVLGLDLGFRELRRHGLIDRRPALVAVQASACAPLHGAFAADLRDPTPVAEGPTRADGVRVGAPPRGAAVLRAVRESGGSVEVVDEDEIEAAGAWLWTRGYAVEPTAAVAVALARRAGPALRRRYGDLAVVLTGSGLKTDGGGVAA